MREIKFRAWDKDSKLMLYKEFYDHNWYTTPKNDEDGCHTYSSMQYSDQYHKELMQFTGLKDKNGKEIYEGDIVKDKVLDTKTKKPEDVARIFEVYWDGETASFWQTLINDPTHKFRSGTNFAAEKDCEVIGNIYENPELIKV